MCLEYNLLVVEKYSRLSLEYFQFETEIHSVGALNIFIVIDGIYCVFVWNIFDLWLENILLVTGI